MSINEGRIMEINGMRAIDAEVGGNRYRNKVF